MGVTRNGLRFLLEARRLGVSFRRTATIGRQQLFLDSDSLHSILADFGYSKSLEESRQLLSAAEGYAEPIFKFFGAEEIRSFDAAPYEGATDVYDFNLPVPETVRCRFDLVYDGGSLEHVFNVPVALANCMEMVDEGGYFIGVSPANNAFGHGFYQFSPEFFYRALSFENGFEVVRMLLVEEVHDPAWFEVADPAAARQRVSMTNTRPASLAVVARKLADRPILSSMPQESDYVALWSEQSGFDVDEFPSPTLASWRRRAPLGLKRAYRRVRNAWLERHLDGRVFTRTHIPAEESQPMSSWLDRDFAGRSSSETRGARARISRARASN